MNLRTNAKLKKHLMRFTSRQGSTVYEYNSITGNVYDITKPNDTLEYNHDVIIAISNNDSPAFELIDANIYTGWKQYVKYIPTPLYMVV